ncbi:MAG: outer membrane protein assembly factor [Candidatus Krumholzibacteriota bacterium]|nr:outer membrane protein assembly factor [Candidatus Krumholzibacteriota bacterium]
MRWFLLVLVSLLFSAPVHPARAARIRVEIRGVSNELKANVEASLAIARIARRTDTETDELIRLHDRADEEIRVALEPFGFYRPVIIATLDESGRRWVARYEIDPGPPLLLESVEVSVRGPGASDPAFSGIVDEFPLREGDRLIHPDYDQSKARFVAVAADSGYLRAEFDSAAIWIDPEAYTSGIVLAFSTGERFTFGDVTFKQEVVDDRVIRGYIRFNKGDPFRARKLFELQSGLTDSGYFGVVEVQPQLDLAEGNMIPIHVTLQPQKRERYDVGVGYGTDTGPRFTLEAELRRLNKSGHKGEVRLQVSQIENSASVRYIIPPIYPKTWIVTFSAGYAQLAPTSSESDMFVVGTTVAHRRWELMESFGLNYSIEKYEVGVDHGTSFLLMPGISWSLARTDDPIFTLKGRRFHVELFGSHDNVLSSATFVRFKWRGKNVFRLREKTRFITRFELGRIWTDEFRELPPTIRFFAGGDQSVRGYEFESLGPTDELGNVIGGPILGVLSAEIDHYFFAKWGVAAFFDIGNAFNTDFDERAQRGTGMGLRWLSPVGLFRVDFAWGLDNDNDFQLHFVIGPDL